MNKRPKCPKCKSQNVELIEFWTAFIVWSPEEPFFNEGLLLPGDPTHVKGNCLNCGHNWRIRKAVQVLEEWFDSDKNE